MEGPLALQPPAACPCPVPRCKDLHDHQELYARVTARSGRLIEWHEEVKTKMPECYSVLGGTPPLPEDLSPELIDVMSKIFVSAVVGGTYGDDRIMERIEYGTNLVRHADLPNLHPFFASANIEDGDMYVWTISAHVYAPYLMSQTGFQTKTSSVARDIFRIQHPRKKGVARPVVSARTNKKKARYKEAATTRSVQDAPAFRSYARLRWKSAIRMQIKLNRMHRVEKAKNIVDRMRRQEVRRAAEAAKAAHKEAPFLDRGPSGPATKHASAHYEIPSVGEQVKRECRKAESIERATEHRLRLQENESLRLAQAEQKIEALRIASQIQNGGTRLGEDIAGKDNAGA